VRQPAAAINDSLSSPDVEPLLWSGVANSDFREAMSMEKRNLTSDLSIPS
jgi:hypothetical protein